MKHQYYNSSNTHTDDANARNQKYLSATFSNFPFRKLLLIIFSFLLCSNTVLSQLNCRNIRENELNSIVCYHINGSISTRETWDNDRREGRFTAWDSSGKELFTYGLRRFAGHSSVYVSYHTNGQVKKAEYSSAPDGGIQFWKIIHEFDESGNQTSFMDLSRPDGRPRLMIDTRPVPNPVFEEPKPEPKEQEPEPQTLPQPNECAVPFVSEFHIVNNTRRSVHLKLVPKDNYQWYSFSERSIRLKGRGDSTVVYMVILAEKFVDPEDVFSIHWQSPRRSVNYQIIKAKPIESENKQIWIWHIIP